MMRLIQECLMIHSRGWPRRRTVRAYPFSGKSLSWSVVTNSVWSARRVGIGAQFKYISVGKIIFCDQGDCKIIESRHANRC